MGNRRSLPGRASQWDAMRLYQQAFLCRHGLEPHHVFLDVGCGPLRGGIPIIELLDTGHYYGLERWEESLAEAWVVLGEAGLEKKEPTLILGDATTDLDLKRKFDFVFAFSVLHHLYDAELDDLVRFVDRHLASDGVFYGTALIGNYAQLDNWFHYPLISRPFGYYQEVFGRNGLPLQFEEVVPVLYSEHMMSARR